MGLKVKLFLQTVLFAFVLAGSGVTKAAVIISDIQAIDLGTLSGGANSRAYDINDSGDIVGGSDTLLGDEHAFIISGADLTDMTDIGTLLGGDQSRAYGINDFSQVVGRANIPSAGYLPVVYHGFIWENGVISDLGAFPPQHIIDSSSIAYAINNSGLIAGSVDLAGVVWNLYGPPNYFPFPPYVRVTDPDPFLPAIAWDINEAGQVTGVQLGYQAYRWEAGLLTPLVTLEIQDEYARGINNFGHVVGNASVLPSPVQLHAVLWSNPATVQDLGTLGGSGTSSEAFDINDDGTVVGYSEMTTGETVAFVWRDDLGMQPLGTLGGANSKAYAVNNAGQIVGESETETGEVHATLWTITFATLIEIDIKPASDSNSINPRNRGVITVAILTTEDFDANTVDPLSVEFGPNAAIEAHNRGHIEDVDNDGDYDLVIHFKTRETGIQCGDTEAILTGETFGGQLIQGANLINTVGCP